MFIKTKKNKEVIMRFFLFLTVFMLMAINLLLNSAIERENSLTLEEIGELLNLTRERVRQIKEKALIRLRHSSRSNNLKVYLG